MVFKEVFRKHRLQMRLSQKDIAEDFGVSASLISQWENGVCTPNLDMLEAISRYFCISTSELLGSYTRQEVDALYQFRELPLERYKKLSPKDKKIVVEQMNFIIDLLERK